MPPPRLSASTISTSDVKELIPEFFYFPEFLVNGNQLDLGCVFTHMHIHSNTLTH